MNVVRRIVTSIGIAILLNVIWSFFRALGPSERNDFVIEAADLYEIGRGLAQSAEKNDGHYPDAAIAGLLDSSYGKAICVIGNLPESYGGKPHAYLYFPGKSFDSTGHREVIGASIGTYQDGKRRVRAVMWSSGQTTICDEDKFLQFLYGNNQALPAPP